MDNQETPSTGLAVEISTSHPQEQQATGIRPGIRQVDQLPFFHPSVGRCGTAPHRTAGCHPQPSCIYPILVCQSISTHGLLPGGAWTMVTWRCFAPCSWWMRDGWGLMDNGQTPGQPTPCLLIRDSIRDSKGKQHPFVWSRQAWVLPTPTKNYLA